MTEQNEFKVAIIDDDDALRDALLVLVTAAGWHADGYASAEAFLASLDGERAGCALIEALTLYVLIFGFVLMSKI